MKIYFKDKKLIEVFSNPREMNRRYGNMTKKIQQRLKELYAAECLEHIRLVPGARLHKLKGKRDNQFAVDLKHPYRLVFEPYFDPQSDSSPLAPDGSFDLKKITAILIIEVVDYHD